MIVSAPPIPGTPAARHRLEPISETSLGPPSARGVHRLAVCPDGAAYLTDREGRLVLLGPEGQVVVDRDVPALAGSIVGACSGDGSLTMVQPDHLVRVERDATVPPRPIPIPSGTVGFVALAAADDGDLLALSPSYGDFLHRVDRTGAFHTPLGAGVRRHGPEVLLGSIVFDPASGNTALFLQDGLEALLIDGSGAMVRRAAIPPVDGLADVRQGLVGLAGARGGGYVLQREAKEPVGADPSGMSVVRSHVGLDLLETIGSRTLTSIERNGILGHLQGADDSGTLFFLTVRRRGPNPAIIATKARLLRSSGIPASLSGVVK